MSKQDWMNAREHAMDARELIGQAMGSLGVAEARLGSTVVRCGLEETYKKTSDLLNEVQALHNKIDGEIDEIELFLEED